MRKTVQNMFRTRKIHDGADAGASHHRHDEDSCDEDDRAEPQHLADLVLTGNIADLDAEDEANEKRRLAKEERHLFEEEERKRLLEVERLRNLPRQIVVADPIPATTLSPSFGKVRDILTANGVPEPKHKKIFAALEAMHEALVGVAAKGTAKLLVELIDPTAQASECTEATKACKEAVEYYKARNGYNDRKQQRHECYLNGPPELTRDQRVKEFEHQLRTVGMRIMALDWNRSQLIEAHAMCKAQKFKGPFSTTVVAAKRARAEVSQHALVQSLRKLHTVGRSVMSCVSVRLQEAARQYEEALERYEREEPAALSRLRAILNGEDTIVSPHPGPAISDFGKGAVGTSNGTTSLLSVASNVDSPSKGSGSPSKRSKELTSINLAQSSDVQPKDRMNPVKQELSPDGRDVAFGTDGDRASPTDKRFLLGLFHDALISAPYLLALVKHAVFSSLCDEPFQGYDDNPNGRVVEVPMQQSDRCEAKTKRWYGGSFDQLLDVARVAVVCNTMKGMCQIVQQIVEMESKGEIAIDLVRNGFDSRRTAPNFDSGFNGGLCWGEAERIDASGVYLNLYIRFIDSPYLPQHMKNFAHVHEVRFVLTKMYAIDRDLHAGSDVLAAEWAKEAYPGFDASYGMTGSLNSSNAEDASDAGISTDAIRSGLVASIDLGSILHVDVGVLNELAQLAKLSLDPRCRLVEIIAANTTFGTNLGTLFSSNPPGASITCHKKLRVLKLQGAEVFGTLDPIEHLDQLRVLDLSSCFGIEGPLDALDGWHHLRVLNLESTRVAGTLEPLEFCTSLEYVNISNCVDISGTLDPLANLIRLKFLWLPGCTRFNGSLFGLLRCRTLTNFNASRSKIEVPPSCPKADAHGPPLVYPDRAACLELLDWMAEVTGAVVIRTEGGFSEIQC